jgi:hypothetical protein
VSLGRAKGHFVSSLSPRHRSLVFVFSFSYPPSVLSLLCHYLIDSFTLFYMVTPLATSTPPTGRTVLIMTPIERSHSSEAFPTSHPTRTAHLLLLMAFPSRSFAHQFCFPLTLPAIKATFRAAPKDEVLSPLISLSSLVGRSAERTEVASKPALTFLAHVELREHKTGKTTSNKLNI